MRHFIFRFSPQSFAGHLLLGLTLSFLSSSAGRAALPTGWAGIDIGASTAGSDTYANGTYILKGAGKGIGSGGDQMHFTSITMATGGNFRITMRIASFNGTPGLQVGLTARGGTGPLDSMAAVTCEPGRGQDASPNLFEMMARNKEPGALYAWRQNGCPSGMAIPCWLQLVRYGNNFAVYKSTDGKFWVPVQSGSGSAFSVPSAVKVGMFVASGGTALATATIDHVKVEKNPVLPYETSWLGNTYCSDYDGYTSGGATSLWVAPDGTCYVTSTWDEGGEGGKSYKDGKVVHGFSLNPGHPFEGSITSDGTHLYYFGSIAQPFNRIYQTSLTGSQNDSNKPLYMETPLLDPKTGANKMTGLAFGNRELYVSDQVTNQVIVLNPNQNTYGVGTNVTTGNTDHAIDTSGVQNPAPASVYQTSFQMDSVGLSIPGLTPGKTYNVRLHFAETNPDYNAPGKRLFNLNVGGQTKTNYDIFAAAGGMYKATTLSFNGIVASADGKLNIGASRSDTTPNVWASIAGVEILNADNSPFLALNCAGMATGTWQTTVHEIAGRAFSITRPGPIAVDKNGDLWITQEANNSWPPINQYVSQPNDAAIKLYDKNGHYLNKQITNLINPTSLSYDAGSDRLLVSENGPAQNIRFYNVYTGTPTAPVCTSTFGVRGGVFAGKTPGLVTDPDAGGDARFYGPTGAGLDAKGNIFVVCNPGANQSDIKAFSPDGKLLWKMLAGEFCNTGGFDQHVGKSDVWTPNKHYTINYGSKKAGSEWKLVSYLTNPFKYKFPDAIGGESCLFRRIHGKPFLFVCGQGLMGPLLIYRFENEQIVPCGSLTDAANGSMAIWTDTNGDGVQHTDEVVISTQEAGSTVPAGNATQDYDVDDDGNIYLAKCGVGGPHPHVDKYSFAELDAHGSPKYSPIFTSIAAPPPFDKDWGNKARLRYEKAPLDTMFLIGETHPYATQTDHNYGGTLACYDHWSTKPVKRFITVLPDPSTRSDFLERDPPYQADGFIYQAFDEVNGISFCSDLWDEIRVVDPHGNLITNIIPGPEVSGLGAWEDEIMGLRVHYDKKAGEYDLLQEGSGWRGREMFYRWTPRKSELQ